MAIAALCLSGIAYGYVVAGKTAEWSASSLAAQSLAMQAVEQTKAAQWIPSRGIDEVTTNYFARSTSFLDLPITGTNGIYATNLLTITTISTTPPLKLIRVDCMWSFRDGKCYTNTVVTYRAPNIQN